MSVTSLCSSLRKKHGYVVIQLHQRNRGAKICAVFVYVVSDFLFYREVRDFTSEAKLFEQLPLCALVIRVLQALKMYHSHFLV